MRLQSFSIKTRSISIIILVMIFGFIVSSLYNYWEAKNVAIQLESSKISLLKNNILQDVKNSQQLLLSIRDVPPIAAILRAKKNQGIDPASQDSLKEWNSRLSVIFKAIMTNNNHIYKIRYIDKDGVELVKATRTLEGIIKTTEAEQLQNKSHRDYVKETLALDNNTVYFSDISLNKEWGHIEKPYTPILRISTPIYLTDNNVENMAENKAEALLIISLFSDELFENIRTEENGIVHYVVDNKGYYLKHPEIAKLFGEDLGLDEKLQNDEPDMYLKVTSNDSYMFFHQEDNEINGFQKIFYAPNDPSKYWLIVTDVPEKVVVDSFLPILKNMVFINLLITALVLFLLIYFISKYITYPIVALSETTQQLKSGDLSVRIDASTVTSELKTLYQTINDFADFQQNATKELNKQVAIRTTKLSTLIDNIVDGVITINEDSLITSFNPAAEKIFSYSQNEVLGKNINILMPEHMKNKHQSYVQHYLKTGESKVIGSGPGREIEGLTKDGQIFPMEISVNKMFFADSNTHEFIAMVRDISKRKQQEQIINESRNYFESLFNATNDAIFIVDQSGHFIDINTSAYERLGYSKSEMLTLSIKDLDTPKFAKKALHHMDEIKVNGKAIFESEHYLKDGHTMPVEISSQLIQLEGKDVFLSTVRDISERKQVEKTTLQNKELIRIQNELEKTKQRYFDLYDLSPVSYCTLNQKGFIQEVNIATSTMLGRDRNKLIKKPLSDFIFHQDQDMYSLYFNKVFKTDEKQECELRMTQADKMPFWVYLTATAEKTADEEWVLRLVINDINQRKIFENHLKLMT